MTVRRYSHVFCCGVYIFFVVTGDGYIYFFDGYAFCWDGLRFLFCPVTLFVVTVFVTFFVVTVTLVGTVSLFCCDGYMFVVVAVTLFVVKLFVFVTVTIFIVMVTFLFWQLRFIVETVTLFFVTVTFFGCDGSSTRGGHDFCVLGISSYVVFCVSGSRIVFMFENSTTKARLPS